MDHPSFANGIASEEWAEMRADCDDDGMSAADRYMRGEYDVQCPDCQGSGKTRVPAVERMNFSQKRELVHLLRQQSLADQDAAEYAAEIAAERRMGC